MDKGLIRYFWNCGDNQIIEFAIIRARLNKNEKDVIQLMLDECLTQEEVAERLSYSTRKIQEDWASGVRKLLSIPWVLAYAEQLKNSKD